MNEFTLVTCVIFDEDGSIGTASSYVDEGETVEEVKKQTYADAIASYQEVCSDGGLRTGVLYYVNKVTVPEIPSITLETSIVPAPVKIVE